MAVYSGDFYEPLRLWSNVLQREGWTLPKPNNADYNVSWCGWGYESEVTPAQMVGTIPKLKEFQIKWATLDDRWFNRYGDWEPRRDTFPGDSVQRMVDEFHKQGILLQIWWLPIGVEDGQGQYESHRYSPAQVAKQHPDWLILDRKGKHARMVRDLAALCPALPEVQEYHKKLTEKFIRDWGFDGHKLDNVYTVPACYNPRHHHKSPQDSINAMAEVYKIIFETTRALKPESITQSCPCGTPPNLAWLPYMDQAVTADPVGSVQVRRRIKMYKALLGPQAAVYGDHVELTEITNANGQEIDLGKDFASTVGTGGVVGTKFVWPDPISRRFFSPRRKTPCGRSGSTFTTRRCFRKGLSWTFTSRATTYRRATPSRKRGKCTMPSSPLNLPRPGRAKLNCVASGPAADTRCSTTRTPRTSERSKGRTRS